MRNLFCKLVCVAIFALNLHGSFGEEFYQLGVKERKEAFINKIEPLAILTNEGITAQLDFCLEFINGAWKRGFRELDEGKFADFLRIAVDYKIKNIFHMKEFIEKIQPVPVSLAIAQAALESGWGGSRFTKEANNIFGHWTWGQKGLVPLSRDSGKTHKIRIFDSLQESVAMYMLNLNSNHAYADFRKLRMSFALRGEVFDGLSAAQTMQNYSELGEQYVKMLVNLIEQFDLTRFDR